MKYLLLALALSSSATLAAQPAPPEDGGGPRGRAHFSGTVFLSPMGEPFRAADPGADVVGSWFAGADRDRDRMLSLAEFQADAARFFETLDLNRDGELGPDEVGRYEGETAPEVQLGMQMRGAFGGRGGGGRDGRQGGGSWGGYGGSEAHRGERRQGRGGGEEFEPGLEGAGRYSFLNIPEPVISADLDLNRGVSKAEFLKAAGQRFLLLDKDRDGRLTRAELPPLPVRHILKGKERKAPPREREGIPLPGD